MQQTLPQTAQAPATPHQPAKREKKQRISKRLAEAIRLLATGECKTQKAAAERANMKPGSLCEALAKPHVRVFYERRARENISSGVLRASARLVELLDADSEHVTFDAAKHVLGIAGIKPAADAQVSVNVDIKAGYVIRLVDPDASGLTQPNNSTPAISTTYEDVTPRNVTDDVT